MRARFLARVLLIAVQQLPRHELAHLDLARAGQQQQCPDTIGNGNPPCLICRRCDDAGFMGQAVADKRAFRAAEILERLLETEERT